MSVTASITNISRGSLHDGPGVRTVIYYKGCLLRCSWCHNPETLSPKKELLYHPSKCIHCGACVEICPAHHTVVGNDMVFSRDGCARCGSCAASCPSLALTVCGEELTTEELLAEIQKDRAYYEASSGGVTFSGGECLLQADSVAQAAAKCHDLGISTALESALFVPWENIQKVLPHIDLFYADLKLADAEKHRRFTGQSNGLILENLQKLSRCHHNIIVRIPVIPGVNDTEADFMGFGEILQSLGPGVRQVELLKYNFLAASKYEALEKPFSAFSDHTQSDAQMEALSSFLERICGIPCSF